MKQWLAYPVLLVLLISAPNSAPASPKGANKKLPFSIEQAEKKLQSEKDNLKKAHLHFALSLRYEKKGESKKAGFHAQKAEELYLGELNSEKNELRKAHIHYALSLGFEKKKNVEKSLQHIEKAEALFLKAGDPNGIFIVRHFQKGLEQKYNLKPAVADKPDFYSIQFGYLDNDPEKNRPVFRRTTQIPFHLKESGFRWGFYIVSSGNTPFSVQFEVETPASPQTLSGELAAKGGTGHKPKKVKVPGRTFKEKGFCPFWFDEGDPLGKWKIDVFINDALHETVEFTVG